MARDILLGDDLDVRIESGDFVIGDSLTQETNLILRMTQGQLKSDPILGPNLFQLLKAKGNSQRIATRVKVHLARDNKNYDEIKQMIRIHAQD